MYKEGDEIIESENKETCITGKDIQKDEEKIKYEIDPISKTITFHTPVHDFIVSALIKTDVEELEQIAKELFETIKVGDNFFMLPNGWKIRMLDKKGVPLPLSD